VLVSVRVQSGIAGTSGYFVINNTTIVSGAPVTMVSAVIG
jgi:hypothetical protein